jgi:hypothetical protein
LIERRSIQDVDSKGEIIPSNQDLRGSWSWVQVPDLEKLYNTLVMEGFTHRQPDSYDYGHVIQQTAVFSIETRIFKTRMNIIERAYDKICVDTMIWTEDFLKTCLD